MSTPMPEARGGYEPEAGGASRRRPPDEGEDDAGCWVCGAPVVTRHCKIICPACGFTRDCSDP